MMRRPASLVVALALAAAGLAGCGRSDAAVDPVAGRSVKMLELASLPGEILGLAVQKEDVTDSVAKVNSTFVDALGLWSLRTASSEGGGDLVQATLQVSRFSEGARFEQADFRQSVVNQIGSARPRTFRLGQRTVYLTTGTKQSIAVWFKGSHLFVLASRSDYDQPRTLLREVLEIKP
ncbi:MAG: hypothetical protein ACRDYV_10495 [Acidimicrobiia bacterium]